MEKIKMLMAHKVFKVFKWAFLIVLGLYFILVVIRVVHFFNQDKIDAAVAKIHSTKLTLDDVMGKNLPPDPGAEANKTVEGVDANENGIRDDVELAIFKEYPNSAKTRAVLLQYALVLQMELTLPLLTTETATALVEDNLSRALNCIWSLSSRDDIEKFMQETEKNEKFVEELQFNTEKRKQADEKFYEYLRSYSRSNKDCDLDLSIFSN